MIVRTMRRGDLEFAAECPAMEGWTSETPEVFRAFHDHDPDGCLIAEDRGRAVGICVATPYGRNGFIGELIVRREARGRSIGPGLLESAVAYLRARGAESIYLDGVKKAVPFYEYFGFRAVCRSLRFAGWAEEIPGAGAGRPDAGRVRPMAITDLPAVRALDREAFGDDRSFFLDRRFAEHPEFAWVAEDGAGVAGFILGHTGNEIVAAGPWVVAERWPRPLELLNAVRVAAKDLRLRVGVLETNRAAVSALRGLRGLEEQPPSRRMVLGPSDRLGNSPMCWAVGSAAKG